MITKHKKYITQVHKRLAHSLRVLAVLATAIAPLAAVSKAAAADGAQWPATGQVTSRIGWRCLSNTPDSNHAGYDIASTNNSPIYATQGGTVAFSGWMNGYGNTLDIDHGNGWRSRYAHLNSIIRNSGTVVQGEHIARMGATGGNYGVHLHFEMRKNGAVVNFNNNDAPCKSTVRAGTGISYPFPGLIGNGGPAVENVQNGGGTRITGPNAYMDVSSQGHVYHWNGPWHGGTPVNYGARIVDAKVKPGNGGYWLVSTSGHIYAYGNAQWLGGSPVNFGNEIVAMATMPNGDGYVLVSDTGNVYAYGNAQWHGGSPGNYSGKFVDIEMTPDGRGYWLLTSAGQIYAYGNAQWKGNATGFARAIVAMSRTTDGGGYVLVSKIGEVYALGNAQHKGGKPSTPSEISDISYRTDGVPGYVMINLNGHHYAYNTPWLGNPNLGGGAIF